MDYRARIFTAVVKFMQEHGILIVGATVTSGMALGPEGALVGALLTGAGASAPSLISSPWWGRMVQLLISSLQLLYPFVRDRMHIVTEALNDIAELLVRLMQRTNLLPSSRINRPLTMRSDRDSPPPAH